MFFSFFFFLAKYLILPCTLILYPSSMCKKCKQKISAIWTLIFVILWSIASLQCHCNYRLHMGENNMMPLHVVDFFLAIKFVKDKKT